MAGKPLTLLADTNLFFECKKLEDLPWAELSADPITILVTRPVLSEIDKHKKQSGRTRDRAIEIYGRIRTMLKSGESSVEIQSAGPKIIFERSNNLKFDSTLSNVLDQSKPDDHLIGLLSSATKASQGDDICLFTHDVGPADTAAGLGLPFRLIDDHWLRPKPQSKAEKERDALKRDLAAYQHQEPQITITLDGYDDPKGPVLLERKTATALNLAQIDNLIDDIKTLHPVQTDFTARGAKPVDLGANILGQTVRYEPPIDEDIESYQNETYPNWLSTCRSALENLHEQLVQPTKLETLRYVMENTGSRPAEHVRVCFRADGDIYIMRNDPDDDDEMEDEENEIAAEQLRPSLPACPRPPQPRRIVTKSPNAAMPSLTDKYSEQLLRVAGVGSMFDETSGIGRMMKQQRDMERMLNPHGSLTAIMGTQTPRMRALDLAALTPYRAPKHDPEAFYFDKWSSGMPVDKGELTCDLWRHKNAPEGFMFDIHAVADKLSGGSLCINVHAQNLTKPVQLRTKIEVAETIIDTFEEAERLIKKIR